MIDGSKYELNNTVGSRNVFEWCRDAGVQRVVSASSAALYGVPETLPLAETAPLSFLSPCVRTCKFRASALLTIIFSVRSSS